MIDQKQISREFDRSIVYVKEVDASYLPEHALLETDDPKRMFAVHDSDGAQLALVANRTLAFRLAVENELVPMNVH